MEEGTIIIFPGGLTHSYQIIPKFLDEIIVFSTRVYESKHCYLVHGKDYQCEGFKKESQSQFGFNPRAY